jgi:hypothetical protein
VGKALKIQYSTEEGRRLFHLSTKIDKALRQLCLKMLQGKFKGTRYGQILKDLDTIANDFYVYLNNSYAAYRNKFDNEQVGSLPPGHRYRGLIKEITQAAGRSMRVIVSNDGIPSVMLLFVSIKSTDNCIKIAENVGIHDYENYTIFRNSFREKLSALERFQAGLSSVAYKVIKSTKNKAQRRKRKSP